MRPSPRAILLAGLAAFVIYAFPGFMSTDSVAQLVEARRGVYSDAHPPLMAMIWRFVELFVRGPLGMLLIQAPLFLFGTYRLLRRGVPERAAALLAVGVLLFPAVLTTMAVIWKDSQMAGFLVMGFALMLDEDRATRVRGVVLLAMGAAMRHNAPAASLPLVVLCFVWSRRDGWRRYALAAGVWIATFAFQQASIKLVATEHPVLWHDALGIDDPVGILSVTDRHYSDAELEEIFVGTPLRVHHDIQATLVRAYTPRTFWGLTHGDDRVFDPSSDDAQRAAIARAWKTLVRANPWAYARHRWNVFEEVLGDSDAPLWSPVWRLFTETDPQADQIHHRAAHSWVQDEVGDQLAEWSDDRLVFRAYVYFWLAVLLIPLAWRERDLLALLLSGLAYEATFFVFASTPDFRYSHWMISCTVIAAVALCARRAELTIARRRRARVEPWPRSGGSSRSSSS